MTFTDHADVNTPMPDSPPDLTGSKSSKSSSFHSSYQSDDNGILSDVSHFEDIGLGDDAPSEREMGDFAMMTSSNLYTPTYATDLRNQTKQRTRVPMLPTQGRVQRELTAAKARPAYPSLRRQVRSVTSDGLGLMPMNSTAMSRRGFASPSTPFVAMMKRQRSPSPNIPISPRHGSAVSPRSRRGSLQSNRERKTALELEKECDEDDGDDVPDECFLENVPFSPRPPQERTTSMPPSASTSPERSPKEKTKNVGNGTPPVPVAQGCLRSSKSGINRGASTGQFPINHDGFSKTRAKSWTTALSELSEEAKALTEALEAHAETEENKPNPKQCGSFNSAARPTIDRPRVKSSIAELPPLRRTNIMIDPLPISKEKEAVLSRTRPSWLPPKNPSEERRHLKEYQKIMALSLEADRKKEAERRMKSACRDDTANSLLRIWEEHVLPNWDEVTRQKRTRELWWRGVTPRSRGKVWAKAVGNELELSDSSYNAALRRAQDLDKKIKKGSKLTADEERQKGWFGRIEKDVRWTYPELKIFQPEGPLHGSLVDVLRAYSMYRSDVGYVHGTSTIAALLLLNLPTASASFITLSNILNRPLPLSFHTSDTGGTSRVYTLFLSTLQHKSPRLHAHLTNTNLALSPDEFLHNLFTSLFTGCLSLDNATRLWDVMVFEGDAVLVRAGVALLMGLEGKLFGAGIAKEVGLIVKTGLNNVGEEEWMKNVREAGKS